MDIVALIAAIASIFGGGTVTPDEQPTIHVQTGLISVQPDPIPAPAGMGPSIEIFRDYGLLLLT